MAAEIEEYAEIRAYLQREFGNRAFKEASVYKWIPLARGGEED
jgi:hypothetical protein